MPTILDAFQARNRDRRKAPGNPGGFPRPTPAQRAQRAAAEEEERRSLTPGTEQFFARFDSELKQLNPLQRQRVEMGIDLPPSIGIQQDTDIIRGTFDVLTGTPVVEAGIGALARSAGRAVAGGAKRVQKGVVRAFPFNAARGVPGEQLPKTIGQLAEGVPASTQKGLVHGPIPQAGAGRRGALTAPEREILVQGEAAGLTPAQSKRLGDTVRDYRRTHSTADGWEPFELVGFDRKPPTKLQREAGLPGDPFPKYRSTGFEFGRGKLTPEARADIIDRGSSGLVREVEEVAARARSGDQNAVSIMGQARWYKDAQREIQEQFGVEGAPFMARLQGGFSPREGLSIQNANSQEFFTRAMKGEFDGNLAAFQQHFANGGNLNNIPDEIIPRKLNGAKFGKNGRNALLVMAGKFDELAPGQAPKMRNFALNLSGESNRPTIDIWAARTVQRLTGGKRPVPATAAGATVPGGFTRGFVGEGGELGFGATGLPGRSPSKKTDFVLPEVTDNYGVALEAFEDAATKLGMDPDDLQAMMWFREKEIWESSGFTNVDVKPDLNQLLVAGRER